ncbi:MAG TPA: hypothetical protein VK348_07575, partial [Planctomycetota bacterium]|nr:hypothetical protein [Planctomycetota bacterium]
EKLKSAPDEPTQEDNPEYKEAVAEQTKLIVQEAREKIELDFLTKSHAEDVKEVKRLTDLDERYNRLREALTSAEEERNHASVSWEAAQRKHDLNLGNFSSLKPIEDASFPREKEGPIRSKLILGGFFVGLFLGLGVIVTRALPDNVVRVREDLERLESVTVIGVVPRFDGRNLRRHGMLRERGW